MGQSETIERVETLAEALLSLLNVYHDETRGMLFLEIARDSLPEHWGAHQITERGALWRELAYRVYAQARRTSEEMLGNLEKDVTVAKHIEIIATVAKEFSEALRDAIKLMDMGKAAKND